MESMHRPNNEKLKIDVRSQEELSPLDGEIIETVNKILKLESDLATETNSNKIRALTAILKEEVANKQALIDKKFAVAIPQNQKFNEPSFDDAVGADGGARIQKRESNWRDANPGQQL